MDTEISSKQRTVVIGPARPFAVIGERINPTGRKKLAEEMATGDFSRVISDALSQVEAGAVVLDVNAGVPGGDEPAIMRRVVQEVMNVVQVPLCFDSANPDALEVALGVYSGKALINSTTGEDRVLERVLPLAKKHKAAVIAVCCDERGPVPDPQVRLAVARKILDRGAEHGIAASDFLFDPLIMTVGADSQAARVTLETIRLLQHELGVNLTGGASNVSFGMPDRSAINAAFIAMAMALGLGSAITNPLESAVHTSILAGDLMLGRDQDGMGWLRDYRKRSRVNPDIGRR